MTRLRRYFATAASVAVLLVSCGLAAAWWVPLPERLGTAGSTVVKYRDGTTAHVFLSPDDKWRIPVVLDEVDPAYIDALLALEDERFYVHPGVDPIAVVRAAGQNLSAGRVVSGASTLTMQLARLLEPKPRTFRSKCMEAFRAFQLELRMDKDEILAAYLTFVPYGGNLEGIEGASLAYFGHTADAMTPAEVATLLSVPQNPSARAPSAANDAALRGARDSIAARLAAVDALDPGDPTSPQTSDEIVANIVRTPVVRAVRRMPRDAPHAARWFRSQPDPIQEAGAPWHGRRIQTTLDRGTQSLAEQTLTDVAGGAHNRGIHNAVVVVADHATGEIRALVGNFDFWDSDHGGQIIGFDVPRSPGSALKPFLYAQAIDQGRVLPETLVTDVPVRYGGYAPKNYDGGFDGLVGMESALSRSLNVPFVELLADVGVEPFLGNLRAMGVTHLDARPGYYGLSVIAGGTEITPLEVTALYVTLANDGGYQPLRWRSRDTQSGTTPVFSPGATWLTQRALAKKDRPDFPARRDLARMPRSIHWKTGTSFGHRDAWAVGSNRTHTVSVWMGNFDNAPSVHLVGSQAAGPVLFDLLEGLDRGGAGQGAPPPEDLRPMAVCALSGARPGDACPHTREVLAPVRRVPAATCTLHRQIEVDVHSGQRVTPGCREGRETRKHTAVVWPTRVRRWLSDRYLGESALPDLAVGCRPSDAVGPPRIVSPARGQVAVLIPGLRPDAQQFPLEAESPSTGVYLSWFVDGELIGRASPTDRVWWVPQPGRHELLVMDDRGMTDRIPFEVRGTM